MSEERLQDLRELLGQLDQELVELIGRRRDAVIQIGETKNEMGLPVLDPPQEAKVVRRAAEIARELGVDEELTRDVVWRIIASARDAQEERSRWGPPAPPKDADGRLARLVVRATAGRPPRHGGDYGGRPTHWHADPVQLARRRDAQHEVRVEVPQGTDVDVER